MTPRIFKPITAIIAVLFAVATTAAQKANPEDGVLINGVVWAKYNVDAPGTFAAKPEDAGMFYQWNSKVAWAATGDVIGWDNTFPRGKTWKKANDPSPTGWRVPTFDEIEMLLDSVKVSNEWIIQNGVNGRKFIDKATGNSIFLSAVGRRYDGTLYSTLYGDNDLVGNYWSSTLYEYHMTAYAMYFNSGKAGWFNGGYHSNGFSVRPVAK